MRGGGGYPLHICGSYIKAIYKLEILGCFMENWSAEASLHEFWMTYWWQQTKLFDFDCLQVYLLDKEVRSFESCSYPCCVSCLGLTGVSFWPAVSIANGCCKVHLDILVTTNKTSQLWLYTGVFNSEGSKKSWNL